MSHGETQYVRDSLGLWCVSIHTCDQISLLWRRVIATSALAGFALAEVPLPIEALDQFAVSVTTYDLDEPREPAAPRPLADD